MEPTDFDYELPSELIAQHPLTKRDESRLMVLGNGIKHRHFQDILEYIQAGDVIVVNNTKVVPALLTGKKSTGALVEIIVIKSIDNRYSALIKGRARIGTEIILDHNTAKVVDRRDNIFTLEFDKELDLDQYGEMPLPPYIKEKLASHDEYQTIYADKPGSIAAPTAGFHFSDELIQQIKKKGVQFVQITLHVSYATFLPVRTDSIEEHRTGIEEFEISEECAEIINNRKGRLFVVGTTTLKALESSCSEGKIIAQKSNSDLFISPGYQYGSGTEYLITNFHLPKSTLIMLVCAFAGKEKIFSAYAEAIKKKYRFYSFGDAMLIPYCENP